MIFADHPVYRHEHRHELPIASTAFGKDEALRVISIYRPFFKYKSKDRSGNMPKLWLAALTIVHELAHKEVGVDDKRYDYKEIKPGPQLAAGRRDLERQLVRLLRRRSGRRPVAKRFPGGV